MVETRIDISQDLNEILRHEQPDATLVRSLLRNGARTAPELRPRLWRLLLLGSSEPLPDAVGWSQAASGLGQLSVNEGHVLAVDVPRTRGEVAVFKTEGMQSSLSALLTRWCLAHGTRYRQGLNEVLAPFMALTEEQGTTATSQAPGEASGETSAGFLSDRERYALFDAFVCRYLAAFYLDGDATPADRQTTAADAFSPEKPKKQLPPTTATGTKGGAFSTAGLPPAVSLFSARLSSAAATATPQASSADTSPPPTSPTSPPSTPLSPPSSGGLRAHIASDGGLPLALRLFGLALRFHDPSLAGQLELGGVGPELYATPWLLTALARGTPLPLVLELWDSLLSFDDPALLPLLCLELLRSARPQLLLSEPQEVIEVVAGLGLPTSNAVALVVDHAHASHASSPRALTQSLRTVCSYIGNQGDGGEEAGDGSGEEEGEEEEGDAYYNDELAHEVDAAAAAVVAAVAAPVAAAVGALVKLDDAMAAALNQQNDDDDDDDEHGESYGEDGGGGGSGGERKGKDANDDDDDATNEEETPLGISLQPPKKKGVARTAGVQGGISTRGDAEAVWTPRRVRAMCEVGVVVLSPRELVESLRSPHTLAGRRKGSTPSLTDSTSDPIAPAAAAATPRNTDPSGGVSLPWMVLDLRASARGCGNSNTDSGGGGGDDDGGGHGYERRALATSLQLSPELLDKEEAFELWLQHFDALRGTPLCVLDTPLPGDLSWSASPAAAAGGGGGPLNRGSSGVLKRAQQAVLAASASGRARGTRNSSSSSRSRSCAGGGGCGEYSGGGREGSYREDEPSPAQRLARLLAHDHGFPKVAVLGGCFEDVLFECKRQQGGSLEPLVVDFGLDAVSSRSGNACSPPPRSSSSSSGRDDTGCGGTSESGSSSSRSSRSSAMSPFSPSSSFQRKSSGAQGRRSPVGVGSNLGGNAVDSWDLYGEQGQRAQRSRGVEKALVVALQVAEYRGHATVARFLRRKLGLEQPLATVAELAAAAAAAAAAGPAAENSEAVEAGATRLGAGGGGGGDARQRAMARRLEKDKQRGSPPDSPSAAKKRPERTSGEATVLKEARKRGHVAVFRHLREAKATPTKKKSLGLGAGGLTRPFPRFPLTTASSSAPSEAAGATPAFLQRQMQQGLERAAKLTASDPLAVSPPSSAGSSGDAWVEVGTSPGSSPPAPVSSARATGDPMRKFSSAFGAATALISKADAWVEKQIDSMLVDETPGGAGASRPKSERARAARTKQALRKRDEYDDDEIGDDDGVVGDGVRSGDAEDEWTEVGVPMSLEVAEALGAVRAAMRPPTPQDTDNAVLL